MALSPFFNTRAAIQWPGRCKPYYGWVSSESDGVLVLETESMAGLSYGQMVNISLMALELSTEFAATFIGEDDGKAIFSVPPSFARHPGKPDARFRNRISMATVHRGGIERKVKVIDIGENGISVVLEEMASPGELIPVEVVILNETIRFKLRVSYSIADAKEASMWRVGGAIEDMGRTDLVRWRRFLSNRYNNAA